MLSKLFKFKAREKDTRVALPSVFANKNQSAESGPGLSTALKTPRFPWLTGYEFLTAAGVAFATAAGSLLLEWLLVAESGPKQALMWEWAWFILVVSLIVAAVSLHLRRGVLQQRGTLYYVRLLHRGMNDFQRDQIKELRENHLDVRAVTRWMSQDGTSVPGCFDFTHDVTRTAEMLQLAMNEDSVDSSFSIAPNMLWPLSMGVGAHHYVMPRTLLVEPSGNGLSKVAVPIEVDGAWRGTFHKNGAAAVSAGLSLTELPEKSPAGTTLLSLDLSGYVAVPPAWHKSGYSLHVDLPSVDPVEHVENKTLPKCVLAENDIRRSGSREHVYVAPPIMADAAVEAIRKVIDDNPGATVMLCARLPKIMPMWLGIRLAAPDKVCAAHGEYSCQDAACVRLGSKGQVCKLHGDSNCIKDACAQPWKRLATLNWDVRSKSYQYYRVHDDQPSLETVSNLLKLKPTGKPQRRTAPVRRRRGIARLFAPGR